MRLWKSLAAFVLTICYLPLAIASIDSPVGRWTTVDDKGNKRAIVELSLSGDTLVGTIIKVYSKPTDTGICSKCPGAFKNKKIQGLQFVWGLKDQTNGVWAGGYILDPKKGKIYRVKMTLEGNKLTVRGFVGTSILGRTQVWFRRKP